MPLKFEIVSRKADEIEQNIKDLKEKIRREEKTDKYVQYSRKGNKLTVTIDYVGSNIVYNKIALEMFKAEMKKVDKTAKIKKL